MHALIYCFCPQWLTTLRATTWAGAVAPALFFWRGRTIGLRALRLMVNRKDSSMESMRYPIK